MRVDAMKSVGKVIEKLKKRQELLADHVSVVVGYNGVAALALHEMTPKNIGKPRRSGIGEYWGPSEHGNKWLEQPARVHSKRVGELVQAALEGGATMLEALHVGGLLIQRESMLLVPAEYGELKRSAFTEKE